MTYWHSLPCHPAHQQFTGQIAISADGPLNCYLCLRCGCEHIKRAIYPSWQTIGELQQADHIAYTTLTSLTESNNKWSN